MHEEQHAANVAEYVLLLVGQAGKLDVHLHFIIFSGNGLSGAVHRGLCLVGGQGGGVHDILQNFIHIAVHVKSSFQMRLLPVFSTARDAPLCILYYTTKCYNKQKEPGPAPHNSERGTAQENFAPHETKTAVRVLGAGCPAPAAAVCVLTGIFVKQSGKFTSGGGEAQPQRRRPCLWPDARPCACARRARKRTAAC